MSVESHQDIEGTVLNVYLPKSQKEEWEQHAAEMDLELSRYVREMVQSGRRPWYSGDRKRTVRDQPGDTEPLKQQVLEALQRSQSLDYEDLLEVVTDNIQNRLDSAITELKDEGRVHQNPRGDLFLPKENEP